MSLEHGIIYYVNIACYRGKLKWLILTNSMPDLFKKMGFIDFMALRSNNHDRIVSNVHIYQSLN